MVASSMFFSVSVERGGDAHIRQQVILEAAWRAFNWDIVRAIRHGGESVKDILTSTLLPHSVTGKRKSSKSLLVVQLPVSTRQQLGKVVETEMFLAFVDTRHSAAAVRKYQRKGGIIQLNLQSVDAGRVMVVGVPVRNVEAK